MSRRAARVRSLAKINLDLRVLGKRPDGYHELRTVFHTISRADTIDIEYRPSRELEIDASGNLDIPDNLIVRAAKAFSAETGTNGAFRFDLTKRIPMGAGLGGGSSNAAAVLLALPALTGRRVPMETLSAVGQALGSDVPFFLHGGAALGIGRGSELYPLPDIRAYGVLVTPGVHVSTPEAYRDLNRPALEHYDPLTTGSSPLDTRSFQSLAWAMQSLPRDRWKQLAANDFETVVFARFPQLESVKAKLCTLGARPALMTGSGSALFGLFDTRASAVRARDAFREYPAFTIELVSRRRYQALWRRQLNGHLLTTDNTWPPRSRYGR
jgi:4-diphosphocytidyl-2-C-methyl-D-erythritol kinase